MNTGPEDEAQVIARGTWTYAENVQGHVWVIKQKSDFYHEEGFDPDPPDLNDEGNAFYVLYGLHADIHQLATRSKTCLSLDEAIKEAERVLARVNWEAT